MFSGMFSGENKELAEKRVEAEAINRALEKKKTQQIVMAYIVFNFILMIVLSTEQYKGNMIVYSMYLAGIIVETIYLVILYSDTIKLYEIGRFIGSSLGNVTGSIQTGTVVKLSKAKVIVESNEQYLEVDTTLRLSDTKIKIGQPIMYLAAKNTMGGKMNFLIEVGDYGQKNG